MPTDTTIIVQHDGRVFQVTPDPSGERLIARDLQSILNEAVVGQRITLETPGRIVVLQAVEIVRKR